MEAEFRMCALFVGWYARGSESNTRRGICRYGTTPQEKSGNNWGFAQFCFHRKLPYGVLWSAVYFKGGKTVYFYLSSCYKGRLIGFRPINIWLTNLNVSTLRDTKLFKIDRWIYEPTLPSCLRRRLMQVPWPSTICGVTHKLLLYHDIRTPIMQIASSTP